MSKKSGTVLFRFDLGLAIIPTLTFPVFILGRASAAEAPILPGGAESIKIRNTAVEAEITVRPFVHLVGFKFIDGKNHLLNNATPNPIAEGHPMRPSFIVGAKLWYAPEVDASHLFGELGGHVTHTSYQLDATLAVDPVSHLQGHIGFLLDEHKNRLSISSAIRNVGTNSVTTSCWWPVSFEAGGVMEATPLKESKEPTFTYHFWSFDDLGPGTICQFTSGGVKLDLSREMTAPLSRSGSLVIKSSCESQIASTV